MKLPEGKLNSHHHFIWTDSEHWAELTLLCCVCHLTLECKLLEGNVFLFFCFHHCDALKTLKSF